MATTFNELLREAGVNPAQVSLLRHQTDKGAGGRTPYMLWRDDRRAFELYQSTQQPRPVFRTRKFWAAFVAPEKFQTMFVGLYEVRRVPQPTVDWLDPLTNKPVGFGKDTNYDLYRYKLSPVLSKHISKTFIDWDRRAIRSWAQYASDNEKPIVDSFVAAEPISSVEGRRYWSIQSKIERDVLLSQRAKLDNQQRFGISTCEACGFENDDAGLFDAHHPDPVATGIRRTLSSDLIILCPICHRRAHRHDRLRPYSLRDLQNWVDAGRPDQKPSGISSLPTISR
ncbi:MAG: HNH endonuclease [Sphingomonadaceae bacterium]|nr:HNH endonuclease [Sphingomonadaceae bacterium]